MKTIQLSAPLECGKCYILQGDASAVTGTVLIRFGYWNGLSFAAAGTAATISSTGAFSVTFDTQECRGGLQLFPPNALQYDDSDLTVELTDLRLSSTCQVYICSECFEVVDTDCDRYLFIEYSHDSDAFGFKYANGANFTQQLLIPGTLHTAEWPYPIEEKHKFANGYQAPIKTDSEQTDEMVTKELPPYLHNALRLAVVHENLNINNESYFKLEGTYQPDFDRTEDLKGQVSVDLQKNNQDKFGDYC
jgi:hypothetical protein